VERNAYAYMSIAKCKHAKPILARQKCAVNDFLRNMAKEQI